MVHPLATVTPIAPPPDQFPTTTRLELIDALCALALASDAELELVANALAPYDITRLAMVFAKVDDDNMRSIDADVARP